MTFHNFYVYVLFDWCGIPRYVGKGKKSRWLTHEQRTDKSNLAKNEFIAQTWTMLNEIPKVKTRENLSNEEAVETEIALIKAIGRTDLSRGPLVNMTNGGDGKVGYVYPDYLRQLRSEQFKALRAAEKANGTSSERGRRNALAQGREVLSERTKQQMAALAPEERSERARRGNAKLTPEQRSERARKREAAFTAEFQSLRALRRAALFTSQQRSDMARKRQQAKSPEQRRAAALKGAASQTKEQLEKRGQKALLKQTPEWRKELSRLGNSAPRTFEQRSLASKKGWTRLREKRKAKS